MKIRNAFITTICFFFLVATATAQTNADKEKITTSLATYYLQERENIYVHFDKQLFFTNEAIWFKGYVFDRKNNQPFFATTNVFAVLMDANGNKISEKLLFANASTFSGNFTLGETYKSGIYYLQFYTNWMNNFSEDESALFEINIVNENDSRIIVNNIDYSNVNIAFQTEGGNLVEGISNNVCIQIRDCNNNPIGGFNIDILNSKSEIIKTVPINKFGFGKLNIIPTAEIYTATFTAENNITKAVLPKAIPNGVALEINNYALAGKVIAKIATNISTLDKLKTKHLTLLVHQDENASMFDIDFEDNNPQKELIFSNDNLYTGVNTIRIFDSDLNQIATRMLFKYPDYKSTAQLDIQKTTKDSIWLNGKLNYANANISISILPENSVANSGNNDIYSAFLFNPYLSKNISNVEYYLNDPSRSKQYELDLLMMTQKSEKTEWKNIQSKPPKSIYDFDFGLTIKGGINQTLSDRKKYQVKLFSLKSFINEVSEIDEKNEFSFRNLILADSSWVNFTLYKESKSEEIKPYTQVLNRKRPFNKMFQPEITICQPKFESITANEMPQFAKDVIALEDVVVKAKAKPKLTYQTKFGNANLRGHKIDTQTSAIDLMSFIRRNGFDVGNNLGEITITGRLKTTVNAHPTSPEVYIDDRLIMNFDELADMQMQEIDEIYINAHAIVASIKNNMGVIKIYRKKPGGQDLKNNSKSLLIENGFAKIMSFENTLYTSTSDKGFQNYGLIHWIPTIMTDENGAFKFQIPKTELQSVMMRIEGFTADGKLISETKIITIN